MPTSNDGGRALPVTGDGEEAPPPTTAAKPRRGGWTTAPFIIATVAGLTLAAGGWLNNLIVFLIQQFNIKSIDAAQINNVVSGATNFFPIIAAVLADSFLGCFTIIWISSLISLLGLILLVLTVTIHGLKPTNCTGASTICDTPSATQYAVLFTALSLVSIGLGGSRFTLATMGANQFTKLDHQSTYFNWYFFALYFSSFISATGIVYVQDNLSWAWGFGICIAGNVAGLALFLAGKRYYYCQDKIEGSPFTSLLRVVVASFRKRKLNISSDQGSEFYYNGDDGVKGGIPAAAPPTNSFRVLNRAALKTEEDVEPNRSSPWKLCTVQQVEDLKTLIKILPLWSTSIILATPIGIQISLTVLQALATDRHVSGSGFQIPAGSIMVFSLISTAMCTSLANHTLWPLWRKVTAGGGRRRNNIPRPTPLQQIGIGHVFNIASMAVSAIVESKRREGGSRHRMSVLWLVPQMVIVGIGEGFHFPGQVALYYQEFPDSLKSFSTAMVALLIAVAFYLSTAVIDFVRRVTVWLPDDINQGRLDYVYWVMVVLGVFNFGYYLVCSSLYKYKSVGVLEEDESS
ncbi:hypothetical protein ACP275_14G260300 [Erythranthe tilingii]